MKPRSFLLLLAVVCLCGATPLPASTIAPPRDLGELLRLSTAVVLAEAGESWGEPGSIAPYTATRFYALEQVSGETVPATFEVWELGGEAAGSRVILSGSPAFVPGRRYLLFLERDDHGRWRPRMLAYGLLEESPDGRLLRPLPEMADLSMMAAGGRPLSAVEPVETYRRDALLAHLREVGLGARWQRSAAVATGTLVETAVPPAACQFLNVSGVPFRWFGFETGSTATAWATTPGQAGLGDGGAGSVQQAVAAWTNHTDSVIRFNYGGARPVNVICTGGSFPDNDPGGVIFNDPCGDVTELSGCAGTLARGGVAQGGSQQLFDGDLWFTINQPFVVVNNGAQCIGATAFAEMMTHELGHSLGFGHHTAVSSPNNPTMSAVLKNDGRGAALVGSDRTCASFAYHTFRDVPFSSSTWRWIEAIENAGVTSGCGSGNYCPAAHVGRDQMAVFLLRAKEGPSYTPPACTVPVFGDVPCSNNFAIWINELADRGITGGCGNGNYCPTTVVNRGSMAIFLLATLEGPGYSPPACVTPTFADVPCSMPAAKWINELAARGITGGCGSGIYCPGGLVTRAQMAVFLAATFGLPTP
jgi:hypothetical protein